MTTTERPSIPDTSISTVPKPRTRWYLLAAAAAPAALGVALGLLLPRGPLTSAQSLLALSLAVVAGLASGWLMRSRWATILAPVVYAATFEIVRLGAQGPTVDAIRFDLGLWGAIVLIAGRGLDGLVILLPMSLAALWGAALARRQLPSTEFNGSWVRLRRAGLVVSGLIVAALVVLIARPAGTAPIVGEDGKPVPGSIAEITELEIGGHDQAIMLRGRDASSPVLLFLEGGPGGTALGAMHYSGGGLEENFVVATWDQRGTGKSLTAREPVATFTLEQAVSDTIEVAEYLRARFGKDRIYVLGSSWGTTLGVLAVQARPDLFQAYIGTGQMVDQQETDKRMYAETLAYAQRAGDAGLAAQLLQMGPPPYRDMLRYPIALTSNPEWDDYTRGPDYDLRASYPMSLFVSEYTFTESVRAMGAIADTFAVMYPQLQNVDFRRDVPRLEVPVYLVQGVHEAPGRADLAEQWFEELSAPSKELTPFSNSGHTPHLDEPGRFAEFMAQVVLAEG